MNRFIAAGMILILCGCQTSYPPYMTRQDIVDLSKIRRSLPSANAEEKSILYSLIKDDPAKLAKSAANRGDYRLIGLAMGYHAGEEDAQPFGIECKNPAETQNVVFGCVPPPEVIFKLMLDYNLTLLQQSGFPPENRCKMPEETREEMGRIGMKVD